MSCTEWMKKLPQNIHVYHEQKVYFQFFFYRSFSDAAVTAGYEEIESKQFLSSAMNLKECMGFRFNSSNANFHDY